MMFHSATACMSRDLHEEISTISHMIVLVRLPELIVTILHFMAAWLAG